MEFHDIAQLLDEFSRLPQLPRVERTILEISGYPHYENVASNILGFFLDPKNGHGLERIVLESLLAAAGRFLRASITTSLTTRTLSGTKLATRSHCLSC
jgi:hypothetical protein